MKTQILGNPGVVQQSHTRFYIHYMDLNRMENMLNDAGIEFFALERPVNQLTWILHIPDTHRREFDHLVQANEFNLADMHQSFWHQNRDQDAFGWGFNSRQALMAVVVVIIVLLIVAIVGFIF